MVDTISKPGDFKLIREHQRYLLMYAQAIAHESLREGTIRVLDDQRFLSCPAACKNHQAYPGGLVVHTGEVMNAATSLSRCPHLKVDNDILTAAVIWHDYGKIYDYAVDTVASGNPGIDDNSAPNKITYTKHQSLIRHLPRSYAMLISEFEDNLTSDILDAIGHCILSHHGRKEWGSPVEPQTTEAYILHFADMLSAYCAEDKYEMF